MRRSDHNHALACAQRRSPSLPEGLLRRELRRKAGGLKFRRQHPVGRFVLDFYCAAAKCGSEIDGIAHDMGDRPSDDAERDAFLARQGIRIVRIPAKDVLRDPAGVAEAMARLCRSIVEGEV